MGDPTGLDERLRAALGGSHPLGEGSGRHVGGLDAARTEVLAGIRRRRTRRLQVLGGGAVVVLGLAVSLPQVLGSATPSTRAAGGSHSKSAASAFAPTHQPENAIPNQAPVAACHVGSETVADCGTLATDSAAESLSATAASLQKAAAFESAQATKNLGSPLVVRAGTRVVIALPTVNAHWRWSTPTIAGTPAYRGHGPPVTVRSGPAAGAAQQFLVATKVPVTVVLEAREDVFTGPGAAPSMVAGSTAVWALELKVVGT